MFLLKQACQQLCTLQIVCWSKSTIKMDSLKAVRQVAKRSLQQPAVVMYHLFEMIVRMQICRNSRRICSKQISFCFLLSSSDCPSGKWVYTQILKMNMKVQMRTTLTMLFDVYYCLYIFKPFLCNISTKLSVFLAFQLVFQKL